VSELSEAIANLHQVTPLLSRGAQPDLAAYPLLAASGVKLVVNLRDDPLPMEPQAVLDAGMKYAAFPMNGWERPNKTEVDAILGVVIGSVLKSQGAFIHCLHGDDRTGVICACYRIRHDGWSNHAAIEEAEADHMSPLEIFMRDFLEEYDPRGQA
jgi:protein tyrosine/serine phosphatase